jgi:phenylalanyl-tRNA synthetase beta chain
MNVYGVAREVAALYGRPLRAPDVTVAPSGEEAGKDFDVTIEAGDLCGRFCARLFDVQVAPSPSWLRDRLELVGVRAINNVVDLTNYVMIELGQPSHAFDLARVPGGALVVRWSRAGERLTTLDGQERTLPARVGVIAAKGGEPALALAGIMGGASSEIHEGTRVVALEAAWWEPLATRRAARALGMHTEASHRFERGADVEEGPRSLDRLAHLAARIGAGRVRPGLVERRGSAARPQRSVRLRPARASALLGVEIEPKRQLETLTALGFEVRGDDGECTVGVPSWRLDVGGEADLAEEVGRHFGLARIPSGLPPSARVGVLRRSQRQERRIREVLAGVGLTEVINYAFVSGADVVPAPGVALANPLSVEQDTLRTSLVLPGLVSTLRTNLRLGTRDVAVFELGRVFLPGAERPREVHRLALLLSGDAVPRGWAAPPRPFDLYDALGLLALLFERLGERKPQVASDGLPAFLHPGRGVRVLGEGGELGYAGALHPELRSRLELRDEAIVLEIAVEALLERAQRIARFAPLDRFPAVERDLSIVCDRESPAAEVLERVRRAAGPKLRALRLVDRYAGAPLPPGKVSLSVSLRFQDDERTLTSEEVQAAVDVVVRELRAAGLEIRGE